MNEIEDSSAVSYSTTTFWFGLLVGAVIVISTSIVIVHLGQPREMNFPLMVGANSMQGGKLLFALSFAVGALLAWQCNPVFVDKTLLAKTISRFSNNHLALARGLLITFWLAIAGFMLWTWDGTTGRFSLVKFKSVTEVLEAGKDCVGEGLLGSFRLIEGRFYANGIEVATLERVNTDSYVLGFTASEGSPRVLLTPINLKNEWGQWLGLGSDLGNVGYRICKK